MKPTTQQTQSRLCIGDLVHIDCIWDCDTQSWLECDEVGVVLELNVSDFYEEDPDYEVRLEQIIPQKVVAANRTFVSILMNGICFYNEYYEDELSKLD